MTVRLAKHFIAFLQQVKKINYTQKYRTSIGTGFYESKVGKSACNQF